MVSTDQRARNLLVPVYILWTVCTKAICPYPAVPAARSKRSHCSALDCGTIEAQTTTLVLPGKFLWLREQAGMRLG